MTDTEKLYETLGELLYVVALSDGIIQASERNALKEILKTHTWAQEVNWSFNYEESKTADIDDLYQKVIAVCHRIGPSPVYNEFIESMSLLAQASDGIDENESKIINSFSSDLIARFKKDIEKLKSESP